MYVVLSVALLGTQSEATGLSYWSLVLVSLLKVLLAVRSRRPKSPSEVAVRSRRRQKNLFKRLNISSMKRNGYVCLGSNVWILHATVRVIK